MTSQPQGPPPDGGWSIGIADDHRAAADEVQQTVAITRGAIATSSTSVRTWERDGLTCHHILDPRRGQPAVVHWRTVSVAAATCVAANTASTAAIVDGAGAQRRLIRAGLTARLVAASGAVVTASADGRVPRRRRERARVRHAHALVSHPRHRDGGPDAAHAHARARDRRHAGRAVAGHASICDRRTASERVAVWSWSSSPSTSRLRWSTHTPASD